ncbi:hypothetical protein [Grimontia hollisae]|uniref:hypothetical protein n=1 Tax=Grimontia hollisae TaxID=673 RepID=UPI001303E090|nr:hypothetical protein [Grimontia hollisae]
MTSLIKYNVTKTVPMIINEKNYTIRLAENADEFVVFVSNDDRGKQKKYHFDRDIASDFKHYHGEELHNKVIDIINSDIEKGLI